jgi:hypothetical protein
VSMQPLFTPEWEVQTIRFDDLGQCSGHVTSPSGFIWDVMVDCTGRMHITAGQSIIPRRSERKRVKRVFLLRLIELAKVSRQQIT